MHRALLGILSLTRVSLEPLTLFCGYSITLTGLTLSGQLDAQVSGDQGTTGWEVARKSPSWESFRAAGLMLIHR